MKKVTRTQVRIPVDLMAWVKQQASQQNRSMNSQLVVLLEQLRKQTA